MALTLVAILERRDWLFDLDGTLVDTEGVHERAYRYALARLAPEALPSFRYAEHRGLNTSDVVKRLPIADPRLHSAIIKLKREHFADEIRAGAPVLKPGALSLIRDLRRASRRCYVVTGAAASSAELVLRHTDLASDLNGVVTSGDAASGKPDPALYLFCLKKFSLAADACVAVEDSDVGVKAALASGVPVIGISGEQTLGTPFRLSSLAELREKLAALGI